MLGPATLKLLAGVGTVGVCAGSAALVGSDPKPQSAPLKPPVNAPAQPAALVIPPSCGNVATLSPRLQAVYTQYTHAATAADKRAVLAALSAGDRQQMTAYIKAQSSKKSPNCGSQNPGGGVIASNVTNSVGATAITNTYVS